MRGIHEWCSLCMRRRLWFFSRLLLCLRQQAFDGWSGNGFGDTAQQVDTAVARHGLDRTQHCRLHGRGDDDRFHTIGITQATQEFHAVHAGHIEIAQRQIAAGGVIEQAGRSMTVGRLQNLLRAHALQQYHRQTAGNRIILQYQHPIQCMPHAANDS